MVCLCPPNSLGDEGKANLHEGQRKCQKKHTRVKTMLAGQTIIRVKVLI